MREDDLFKIYRNTETLLLGNVMIADNFVKRLFGLMGRKHIDNDYGLIIKPCNSIHTFFMKFNIDIAFIDKNDRVIYIYRNLQSNKISRIFKNSSYVIECNADCLKNLKIGDKIQIIKA